MMKKEEFYDKCADILNIQHEYKTINQFGRTGRWGPRQPGNGRYEGFGVIRWYSSNFIHIMPTGKTPVTFKSEEEVFNYLRNM